MTNSIFVRENPKYGSKIPVSLWIEHCNDEDFIDDDGFGCASNGIHCTKESYYPSDCNKLPKGTTHIIWFNK